MEGLRLAPPQPTLLHRTETVLRTSFIGPHFTKKCIAHRIRVSVSKPTAEVSSPTLTSSEDTVASSPSQGFVVAPSERPRVSANSLQYPSGYLGAIPERSVDEGNGDVKNAMECLTNILSSKVYDVAIESPLQLATKLSERLGNQVWLKREDLQPVFSFKLRGAYNMMAKLTKEQLEKGVICSSAGNHAQGVALAAKKLGCNAVIAMPVTTPEIKWQSVERLAATVVLVGDSYDEAQAYAKKRAKEGSRTFIPPFDHPDVIMGQGTVGMEIVRQMQGPLHAIFVPVGGGGLIAGIAAYVKRVSPEVGKLNRTEYEISLVSECQCLVELVKTVSLTKMGGRNSRGSRRRLNSLYKRELGFAFGSSYKGNLVLDMFEEKRSILEPAGALALAGAEAYCKYCGLKGKNIVAITSGANMNFDKLRVVTELANVGRKQEAVLATILAEKPGSFKQFCELLKGCDTLPSILSYFRRSHASRKKQVCMSYMEFDLIFDPVEEIVVYIMG
ncbi:hypothetical protein GOBAR_AA23551 [Gossypium barbadense]|uniref:Tryptophan synthase beta chain-like PALP domain-containing protein n=1 Tax=Gossypium barbadense TaxID=3634 RepID=A0A2P5X193_GOSBA|nr:hypothetical protein GOBAR_AA23551 [Gossypium barbadense]